MKKYLILLVPVFLLGFQPDASRSVKTGIDNVQTGLLPVRHASWTSVPGDDLAPTVSQEHVEQVVTKLFSTYHYRKVRLSDSLSSVVWDNYLGEIDNGRAYLLASDVQSLEKYRYQIDDALVNGDLTAAYEAYNLFQKRYRERAAFVQEQLKQPFTFTEDESFNTDREKALWPKNVEEQNDLWRRMLKNQALDLKLNNRKDSAVTATMKDRYKNLDRYISRVKSEDVFQMYLNAYAEALDPHTNYFNPRSQDQFNQEMSQSLEGIGAMLREEGDYIKIADLVPGGPAFRGKQLNKEDKIAGVAQGDNGPMVNVQNWQVDEVVKLIKGPKGTVVRLQVIPMDASASAPPKEIRIVREKIKLEEQRAKKDVLEVTENGHKVKLGIITLPLFYRDFEAVRRKDAEGASTTADVKRLVEALKAEKVDGIVMDLRGNGGGSLIEAIDLTDLFIPKGPVVQVREQTGETEVYAGKDGGAVTYDGPLAVLTDRFSASASEIFAAAIQDYKRGLIVGGQTYGKGTVQSLYDLSQWLPREPEKVGQVKLTIQKFYRINGSSTQHKGVTPDVELPSAFSAEKYGESSQPSALPWDQIKPTSYETTRNIDDKIVRRLRDKLDVRQKTDADLKRLAQEAADFRKAKENTVVSLLETKRRKERDEAEQKRTALNKATTAAATTEEGTPDPAAPKKRKDFYLTEAGRIMADYIAIAKHDPQLTNR